MSDFVMPVRLISNLNTLHNCYSIVLLNRPLSMQKFYELSCFVRYNCFEMNAVCLIQGLLAFHLNQRFYAYSVISFSHYFLIFLSHVDLSKLSVFYLKMFSLVLQDVFVIITFTCHFRSAGRKGTTKR